MKGSDGTRYDVSNRPTPVFCIERPKFATRTCTAATFELVSTVPDANSPPLSAVPGAMSIEIIAGGASAATRGDVGSAVFAGGGFGVPDDGAPICDAEDAVAAGDAEDAVAAGDAEDAVAAGDAEDAVAAGDVDATGACAAEPNGDGDALAAVLDDEGAEQALLETSNATVKRAGTMDGDRNVIGVEISLRTAQFSALGKKRDTPRRRNRVR